MKTTTAIPSPSRTSAIAAAISGCWSENAVTPATAKSSAMLAPMFVNGSGEALSPRRKLALTPWLTSARVPLPPPASAWSKVERSSAEANSTPIAAADRGPHSGVDAVPEAVDDRHLVGDELDHVHDRGGGRTGFS